MHEWAPELVVDEDLARRLIGAGFPGLDVRSLTLLAEGWDNAVWVADDEWAFRFPQRAIAVRGVLRELEALPRLAPLLPLAVPVPVFRGEPAADYPWPFFGFRLLPGREAALAGLDEDGPKHMPDAQELLGAAAALPPSTTTVLVHGDLHSRHLLLDEDDRLVGVIDWGDACLADPSVDLSIVWSLLPAEGRRVFADEYGPVDEETDLRARMLALHLTASIAYYAHVEGMKVLEREALEGLRRVVAA